MKSYVLKSLGQLFLLLAFLGQWLFLDVVRNDEEDMKQAVSEVNQATTITMLHFELFQQTADLEHLKKAAASESSAMIQMTAMSDPPKAGLLQLIKMTQSQSTITDEASYLAFRKNAEDLDAILRIAFRKRQDTLERRRIISWSIVILMSVVGLGGIASGEYQERQRAASGGKAAAMMKKATRRS